MLCNYAVDVIKMVLGLDLDLIVRNGVIVSWSGDSCFCQAI